MLGKRLWLAGLMLLLGLPLLRAQLATVRGSVFDQTTGEPISFGTVRLLPTDLGVTTDLEGFFTFANIPAGNYRLLATYVGYDSSSVAIELRAGEIEYSRIYLESGAVELNTVDVSAAREQARSDVQVARIAVTPAAIRSLPSAGGEADLAQYLPVLPGIVSTGDQGGQLYIRGGSPVQNKILLDGMTIYNPFHSIGLFSVFETEAIRGIDVYTAGFNAEYGGRVSAIIDIETREGNKRRPAGLVSASPFQVKALLEGPIRPLDPATGSSISFLLTGKHSYLQETSKQLYAYAVDTSFYRAAPGDTSLAPAELGLPYRYTDLYGKLSVVGGNGSKLDLFGFNFTDRFAVPGLAELDWINTGGGASFNLVPTNSNVVIDGTASFSDYEIGLLENDGAPRRSGITTYNALLNFTYFGRNNQVAYGFEFNSFNTDFRFRNPIGITFEQVDFTTELAGYLRYKQRLGNLILEPGLRAQFYASQSRFSLEPRLGLKYNVTDYLRLKAAGGLYSQNLIGTANDLDVVSFFIGFLAGPEETIFRLNTRQPADDRLQHALHGVAGLELDLNARLSLNLEGYYKGFTQLIAINRAKRAATEPDFVTEEGSAYGGDLTLRYGGERLGGLLTYTYTIVRRNDGEQVYPTSFDRRHNLNVLTTYHFGSRRQWELGLRWNYGSAFPFTQTQGFYQDIDLTANPVLTDFLTGNFGLGIILSDQRNGGRLSDFHRLDASLKRTFRLGTHTSVELVASVTNVYDRENIFYVDRLSNRRVNQLPILPSLGLTFRF